MIKPTRLALAAGAAALALALGGCAADGGADAGADTGEATETRTVVDATGTEVEVPAAPERVVTLHYAATQAVLDLGAVPVGQGVFEENIVPEDYIDTLADVPIVTEASEPLLEDIAAVTPDLILAPNTTEEETLAQLEAIAPVYTFTLRGGDRAEWGQRTEEVADALNVSDRVDELKTAFEARQQEIAEAYADVIEGTTVAVIGAYEENNFYAWGENNMTGTLLMPLGFTWSAQENAAVEAAGEPEATVSNEKLASTVGDADVLFLDSDLRGEVQPFMAELQQTALYGELPAVKADRVFLIGKNTVAGYTDANYTLDRVEEALEQLRDAK